MFRSGAAMPHPASEQLVQCTPRLRPARRVSPAGFSHFPRSQSSSLPESSSLPLVIRCRCLWSPSSSPSPGFAPPFSFLSPFSPFCFSPLSLSYLCFLSLRRVAPCRTLHRRLIVSPTSSLPRQPPAAPSAAANTGEHNRTQTPTFQRIVSVLSPNFHTICRRHAERVMMRNGKIKTDRGNKGLADKAVETTNRFVGTKRTHKAA